MKHIISIIVCALILTSCSSPQIFAQKLTPYEPVIDVSVCDAQKLIDHKYQQIIRQKDSEIETLKDNDLLLRTEIDALKKKILQLEIDYKIEQVRKNLNKITAE